MLSESCVDAACKVFDLSPRGPGVFAAELSPKIRDLLMDIHIGSTTFHALDVTGCVEVEVFEFGVIAVFPRNPMVCIPLFREAWSAFGCSRGVVIALGSCLDLGEADAFQD